MKVFTLSYFDNKKTVWFIANFATFERATAAAKEITADGFSEYAIPNAPDVETYGPIHPFQLWIQPREVDAISAEYVPVLA